MLKVDTQTTDLVWIESTLYCSQKPQKVLQGGFDPSKKSGVGVDFELLVRCLLLENKVEARKPSMIFR